MSHRLLVSLPLMGALLGPMGCGFGSTAAPPPPVDDSRPTGARAPAPMPAAPAPTGMSGTTKLVVLAGAAALYYMYKHHQAASAAATGAEGQYYLSKNGRVYYRDAEHRAHWVTPPAEGMRVPEAEAGEYRQFQGYDGSTSGRDLAGISNED